jgi:hypothetical protein
MDPVTAGHYLIMTEGNGNGRTDGDGDQEETQDEAHDGAHDGIGDQSPGPDGPGVVRAAGDLDLHTGPALRGELLSRITGGERDLVVDMSDVSYWTAAGSPC